MSRLTTRDALAKALHNGRHARTETTCGTDCPYEAEAPRWADALLTSGTVVDAAELPDGDALGIPLRALAAALSERVR